MGKRAKTLIIVAASVLLLGGTAAIAGPPIYRDYSAAPAAESPILSADDSALSEVFTGPLNPAIFSGSWAIGKGSYAGYRVNEVLNGTPVTVTGRTEDVTGTLKLDGLTLSQAEISVDVASIATDQPQRDSYFRDQLIKVSKHPNATFSLTAPITATEPPNSGEIVEQTVSGKIPPSQVPRGRSHSRCSCRPPPISRVRRQALSRLEGKFQSRSPISA